MHEIATLVRLVLEYSGEMNLAQTMDGFNNRSKPLNQREITMTKLLGILRGCE